MKSELFKKEEPKINSEKHFDRLSDEELVFECKNDNIPAFEELASRYDKTITYYSNLFNNDSNSFDDLYQEGLLAVFRAALLYNDAVAKFSTFVTLCIKRRMLTYLKSVCKNANIVSFDELSDSENIAISDDPEQHLISEDFLDNLYKEAKFHLSGFENKVFLLRARGFCISDICKELDAEKRSVDNALFRIRKKLKNINL